MLAFVVVASSLGLAAWLILAGHRLGAGVAALVAAVAMALSALEVSPRRFPRLAFAGRLLDRTFEATLLAPMAWVARHGSDRVSVLALVGLGASYLASYERARGESLGYREREGDGYRVLRLALLVFALLTGWIEASLWAFAAVTVAASAVRAANVARQERRARGMPGVAR
jgi:hypothetical protein